jgi:hypothetical protein
MTHSSDGMGRATEAARSRLHCLFRALVPLFAMTMLPFGPTAAAGQQTKIMVRVSEIEVVSSYLEEYKAILKEEAAASVRLEPGVIAIFPMYQKEHPTQ